MYLFAPNRVRKYSGAVAARPRAGFGRVISRGGPSLVLTRVVTALNDPPRYVIGIAPRCQLHPYFHLHHPHSRPTQPMPSGSSFSCLSLRSVSLDTAILGLRLSIRINQLESWVNINIQLNPVANISDLAVSRDILQTN